MKKTLGGIIAIAAMLLVFAGPAFADSLDPALASNGSGSGAWLASESLATDPWTGYTTVEYVFSSTDIGSTITKGIVYIETSGTIDAVIDFEDGSGPGPGEAFVYTSTATGGSGIPTTFIDGGTSFTPVVENNSCTTGTPSTCLFSTSSSTTPGYGANEAANSYTTFGVLFDGLQTNQSSLATQVIGAPEPSSMAMLGLGLLGLFGLVAFVRRRSAGIEAA